MAASGCLSAANTADLTTPSEVVLLRASGVPRRETRSWTFKPTSCTHRFLSLHSDRTQEAAYSYLCLEEFWIFFGALLWVFGNLDTQNKF